MNDDKGVIGLFGGFIWIAAGVDRSKAVHDDQQQVGHLAADRLEVEAWQ